MLFSFISYLLLLHSFYIVVVQNEITITFRSNIPSSTSHQRFNPRFFKIGLNWFTQDLKFDLIFSAFLRRVKLFVALWLHYSPGPCFLSFSLKIRQLFLPFLILDCIDYVTLFKSQIVTSRISTTSSTHASPF